MRRLCVGEVISWNLPEPLFLVHYRKLAFMGFVAVIKNLGAISRNIKLCKRHIIEFKPDVVIFIDYPGFNLRIAEFAKKSGYRTFYSYRQNYGPGMREG
jgi:lipid A disaccharide synthetase